MKKPGSLSVPGPISPWRSVRASHVLGNLGAAGALSVEGVTAADGHVECDIVGRHLLDGLRYLYGEPLSVYATCSRGIVKPGVDASPEYDTDDHSTAVIRFANQVTATLVSGCYSKNVSSNSGLVITLDDMVIDYRLRNNLILRTAVETRDVKRQVDQTYLLDRAFIDAVKTGDPSGIRSPYSDALKTLKLGFAANRSMENGQVIYF